MTDEQREKKRASGRAASARYTAANLERAYERTALLARGLARNGRPHLWHATQHPLARSQGTAWAAPQNGQ